LPDAEPVDALMIDLVLSLIGDFVDFTNFDFIAHVLLFCSRPQNPVSYETAQEHSKHHIGCSQEDAN
jgi:hypothetical protein